MEEILSNLSNIIKINVLTEPLIMMNYSHNLICITSFLTLIISYIDIDNNQKFQNW